jgi:hypothetical protein
LTLTARWLRDSEVRPQMRDAQVIIESDGIVGKRAVLREQISRGGVGERACLSLITVVSSRRFSLGLQGSQASKRTILEVHEDPAPAGWVAAVLKR